MLALSSLFLLPLPTDGPRWVLSELAPSDGYRIEVAGDPIPLPADVDGDGVNELLLADAPGDRRTRRLRVVSPITGRTILEHETPLEWGEHFCTLPLSDLDRGGEAETAIGFRQPEGSTRTIALLDGEDGGGWREDAGRVEIHSGRTGFILLSFQGADRHEGSGRRVGAAGDVNRDGLDDVFIATDHALWVLYGSRAGFWAQVKGAGIRPLLVPREPG